MPTFPPTTTSNASPPARGRRKPFREHPDGPRNARAGLRGPPSRPIPEAERALWEARNVCAACYKVNDRNPPCREGCPHPAARAACDVLSARYWPLVREVVKSILNGRKTRETIESEDIESACAVRFLVAVRRFNLAGGASPKTFIARTCQWETAAFLREQLPLPPPVFAQLRRIAACEEAEVVPTAKTRAARIIVERRLGLARPIDIWSPANPDHPNRDGFEAVVGDRDRNLAAFEAHDTAETFLSAAHPVDAALLRGVLASGGEPADLAERAGVPEDLTESIVAAVGARASLGERREGAAAEREATGEETPEGGMPAEIGEPREGREEAEEVTDARKEAAPEPAHEEAPVAASEPVVVDREAERTLGQRVREARRKAGLRQVDLARIWRSTVGLVIDVERHGRLPRHHRIRGALAEWLRSVEGRPVSLPAYRFTIDDGGLREHVLAAARRLGLSVARLADAVGVTRACVYSYVHGLSRPRYGRTRAALRAWLATVETPPAEVATEPATPPAPDPEPAPIAAPAAEPAPTLPPTQEPSAPATVLEPAPPSVEEEFGARLRAARLAVGASQRALGSGLAVSEDTVALWENGKRRPSPKARAALLRWLARVEREPTSWNRASSRR